MRRIPLAILSLSSLLFWQCGVQTDIASNYYNDGIYFDPTYATIYMDNDVEEVAAEDYYNDTVSDYYNPNDYAYIEEQSGTQGNWFGGVSGTAMSSPYGWNTGMSLSLGYGWGDYGMYPGYGMGYPGYGMGFPGYGMGMYNPWCPGYGMYPGYGMGNPYYPPYGYGYGYPNYGNDFGGFWQGAHSPDVVINGTSGPRGNRNNVGGSSTPARTTDWPTKSGKTSIANSTTSSTQTSKLRTSYVQNEGRSYNKTQATKGTSKKYYQRVNQSSTSKKGTSIANTGRSYNRSTTTGGNSLQRQTNRVTKSGNSGSWNRSSSGTRSYNSTSGSRSTGASRSSGTSRSSGASRSGGSRTTTTTRSRR